MGKYEFDYGATFRIWQADKWGRCSHTRGRSDYPSYSWNLTIKSWSKISSKKCKLKKFLFRCQGLEGFGFRYFPHNGKWIQEEELDYIDLASTSYERPIKVTVQKVMIDASGNVAGSSPIPRKRKTRSKD